MKHFRPHTITPLPSRLGHVDPTACRVLWVAVLIAILRDLCTARTRPSDRAGVERREVNRLREASSCPCKKSDYFFHVSDKANHYGKHAEDQSYISSDALFRFFNMQPKLQKFDLTGGAVLDGTINKPDKSIGKLRIKTMALKGLDGLRCVYGWAWCQGGGWQVDTFVRLLHVPRSLSGYQSVSKRGSDDETYRKYKIKTLWYFCPLVLDWCHWSWGSFDGIQAHSQYGSVRVPPCLSGQRHLPGAQVRQDHGLARQVMAHRAVRQGIGFHDHPCRSLSGLNPVPSQYRGRPRRAVRRDNSARTLRRLRPIERSGQPVTAGLTCVLSIMPDISDGSGATP